ncbi:mitochondrial splicing system protein [Recurvomyces mirabilis]|uniref:Mitochondrial splicing system protein n=1 Tax=Recurvomyces mirabilis TaxID=574656 RepID=A0AAE0WJI5_9PEZI|nr:mitochondrial splicing system protein [Recurvomyces mirabilis]KAK5155541.1 mitochondrial splicing system protein [Recurvomyces mirabilis]
MKASFPRWRAAIRDIRTVKVNGNSVRPRLLRHGLTSTFAGAPSTAGRGLPGNVTSIRPLVDVRAAHHPTIYALSTAPGRAAIAVIRISGPTALDVYQALCPGKQLPRPRRACVRTLYEPASTDVGADVLDASALVLYFPAPRTVTGEDVLELHVHGGPAIVKAVLAAIPRCVVDPADSRIRYAEPGEFTKRAFMNGRLDLTQVEALGDVLAATTEQQRRLSVRGTSNGMAKRYEDWRQSLLYARGELEALIDFSEDQHFDESPAELCASVAEQVVRLRSLLQLHQNNAVRGELLRNGIKIALLGAPNAGKSSLLNRVVGREAAIVSNEAGTTRDIVEVGIDLGGYLCLLGDTAGLRKAKEAAHQSGLASEIIGQVEEEGMRRAKVRAAESDVVIAVVSFEDADGNVVLRMDDEVMSTASDLLRSKKNLVVVINKVDKVHEIEMQEAVKAVAKALPGLDSSMIFPISCKEVGSAAKPSGSVAGPGNVQAFLTGLIQHFHNITAALLPGGTDSEPDASVWQESLGATERHRSLLEECVGYLDAFLAEVQPSVTAESTPDESEADIVVAAEHLRGAADCLAKITGRGEAGDVEEVLGVVFEKFCVGK